MARTVYWLMRCPGCSHEVVVIGASTASHRCPNKRNRWVQFDRIEKVPAPKENPDDH